jgi:hypothetical protein
VANINLHVGRAASRALGMPDPGTSYDKIVGLFTPRLVEAQQQYARDLLGRTNRYRNLRYGADPAIAFVEVTNEDSFFMWDGEDRLRDLPPYYASILRARYAAWLRERYGTTPALAREWSRGAMPLGSNLLASADAGAWRLEQHAGCAATLTPRPGGFRVAVERADDTSWHLQLKQAALRVAAAPDGVWRTAGSRAVGAARAAGRRGVAARLAALPRGVHGHGGRHECAPRLCDLRRRGGRGVGGHDAGARRPRRVARG